MNEHETTADIIADKRFDATTRDQFDSAYIVDFCDRLEAAHKREAVTGSNQLREALEFCVKGMCGYCRMDAEARGMTTECVNGCEALLMAKAALAAPPRNCDVGTADEQFERFGPFCNRYDDDCTGCPCDTDSSSWNFTNCFARWAQMPYEEGGSK